MQEELDTRAMVERAGLLVEELRKSQAFPAVVGGIAGGIAGALMAALIASRVASSRAHDTETTLSAAKESRDLGINVRELVQFAGIAATLAKQAQEWYQERQGKRI